MRYKINSTGAEIIADQAFMDAQHAGDYTLIGPDTPAQSAPAWSDPNLDPRYWWIDIGPFFDRFGLKALSITSSTDAQVQGLVTLILPRQYVDLKRADLAPMLDLLIAKGLITATEKTAIMTTPTTDYERHIKGLPQPTA